MEDFSFEPGLEEGLSKTCLAELAAANIRLIHARWSDGTSTLTIFGLDGQFRAVP